MSTIIQFQLGSYKDIYLGIFLFVKYREMILDFEWKQKFEIII